MHKNSFEGMFLERVFSETEVQDAVHNDCSSVLCSLRRLLLSPCPHGSCSSRNERQNYVSFPFGGSALIRNSCIVRSSNCFLCVLLFILKPYEDIKKNPKPNNRAKQNKNPNEATKQTNKNPLLLATNKQFFRSKCVRKQKVNKLLTLYKSKLLVS